MQVHVVTYEEDNGDNGVIGAYTERTKAVKVCRDLVADRYEEDKQGFDVVDDDPKFAVVLSGDDEVVVEYKITAVEVE